MADSVITVVMGVAFVIAGWLSLRAKSLILPGYRQFGMSDDANWAIQRIAGWLAIGWGGLALVWGVVNLIGSTVN